MFSNSRFNKSISHDANSAALLSINLNAFTCSSLKSSAIIHGISVIFNNFAALYRVCPATIILFLSKNYWNFESKLFY